MKSKAQILKMNKAELQSYKWDDDLDLKKDNSNCFNCSDCYNCSYCFDCSNCSYCSHCSYCSYCSYCSDCYNCSYCFDCSDCSNCFSCRNLKDEEKHQYKICNVQLTKEEYEKKIAELEKLK